MAAALSSLAAADPSPRDEAKRLKELGAAALDRGDAGTALGFFADAYRVFPSPNLRYDMALAQMIVALIRNRSLNGIWLEALRGIAARARSDPAFAHTAGGILVGVLPARDAASRRFAMAAIGQGARLIAANAVLALGRSANDGCRSGMPCSA